MRPLKACNRLTLIKIVWPCWPCEALQFQCWFYCWTRCPSKDTNDGMNGIVIIAIQQ